MSTRNTVKVASGKKAAPTPTQAAVQEALEVTWTLKGHLKNAQVAYIRVGVLLAAVRAKKLYAGLKSFLSKLRLLRKRGAELASMPPEVITDLDAAIERLKNVITAQRTG